MRSFALLFVAALVGVIAPASAVGPADAQPVYFWPMRDAFDQYIAEAVAGENLLSVTVDPKLARSVMTERIDAEFLAAMDELFPREEPAPPAEAEDDDESNAMALQGEFRPPRPTNRPMGRPTGTIFLVDVETRRVIWSTFMGERDNRAKNLHKEAERVVDRLMQELEPSS